MVGRTERGVDARLDRAEQEIARLKLRTWWLAVGLVLAIGAVLDPDTGRDVILVLLVVFVGVVGFIRLVMTALEHRDRSSDDLPEEL